MTRQKTAPATTEAINVIERELIGIMQRLMWQDGDGA